MNNQYTPDQDPYSGQQYDPEDQTLTSLHPLVQEEPDDRLQGRHEPIHSLPYEYPAPVQLDPDTQARHEEATQPEPYGDPPKAKRSKGPARRTGLTFWGVAGTVFMTILVCATIALGLWFLYHMGYVTGYQDGRECAQQHVKSQDIYNCSPFDK